MFTINQTDFTMNVQKLLSSEKHMKYFSSFIMLLLIAGCSSSSTPKTIAQLETAISERLEEPEGEFAVVFQSLDDADVSVLINENERFHAASTMKTPVIMELYKQAEAGNLSPSDSIQVHNSFKSIVDGSDFSMDVTEDGEQDLYHQMGQKTTLYHLAYRMITRSSNLATNILIDRLGAEEVTKTMRSIGADSIEVLRGVEDIKAYEAGLSNTTTALDLAILFEELALGNLLSEDSKTAIIEILKDQKFNDMFPAKLPKDTPVAHKTGWITGVNHDSGIIYLPDGGSFVLVFLSKNAPNRPEVLEAAADVAKLCYDFMMLQ